MSKKEKEQQVQITREQVGFVAMILGGALVLLGLNAPIVAGAIILYAGNWMRTH
jgi:uncharacterized membrane protein